MKNFVHVRGYRDQKAVIPLILGNTKVITKPCNSRDSAAKRTRMAWHEH